tara:strand:- start:501 stop:854 length:354 start_codon:yes stop_codon:yes gene_type:complete
MNKLNDLVVRFFKWLKSFSFYRSKFVIFTTLISGILFDCYIKIDLEKNEFIYSNGSTSLAVLIALILTAILFVFFNFWFERCKIKEKRDGEFFKILKDATVSDTLKSEIIKLLRDNK